MKGKGEREQEQAGRGFKYSVGSNSHDRIQGRRRVGEEEPQTKV